MFGIYLHWPFCESKCPYCDFNSHVWESVDQSRWREAFISELDRCAAETGSREVTSIFVGGGTPSLMPPETMAAIIDGIAARWPIAPDVEITAEANPGSVEVDRFAAFRDAGVNRISIGVQSLHDDALQFLGRVHDAAAARTAIAAAARIMPRYSFDLIYARPGQSAPAWREELTEAISLAGDHMSVYQLTIEPGTDFHRQRVAAADEDPAADMFEMTQEILSAAGLPAYEISNHARLGAECRHNLVYWQGGDYLGIGPGAHGRLTTGPDTARVQEIRDPAKWLEAVEQSSSGTQLRTALATDERRDELIMMGLRLAAGIDAEQFAEAAGQPLDDALDKAQLSRLCEGGFLTYDGVRLAATDDGRQRLDAVLGQLLGSAAGVAG